MRINSIGSCLRITAIGLFQMTFLSHAQAPVQPPETTAPIKKCIPAPHQEFEVVSVHRDKSSAKSVSNISLTSGDEFTETGGLIEISNIVLIEDIAFAYKLTNKQLQEAVAQYPWVAEENYTIHARASCDPTKDGIRSMMSSLLEDRFKLHAHFEAKEVPVFGLVFVTPGKWGAQMRPHKEDDPVCHGNPDAGNSEPQFPKGCGGIAGMPPSVPGRMRLAGRDVSLKQLAGIAVGPGNTGRPVIDETGLDGRVDFNLEWQRAALTGDQSVPDDALMFPQALKEQLGLKLVPHKGVIQSFVIDHLERPDAN